MAAPTAPDAPDAAALAARAAARGAAGDWVAAVDDARRAVEADGKCAAAHLQRGIALFHLDEFEAAAAALETAVTLQPSSADAATWLRKARAELSPTGVAAGPRPAATTAAPPATPPPPAPAYRHQWFQTLAGVEVDVLAKGLPAAAVRVAIEPRRVVVAVDGSAAAGSAAAPRDYELAVDLWAGVDVGASTWRVTPSKIEIKLAKAQPGAWADLAACGPAAAAAPPTLGVASGGGGEHGAFSAPPAPPTRPTYPSSAPRRVDWDAVEREAAAEQDAVDGDAALQRFFQTLYADADDDTRRAMVKSYVESKGTSLSTVWKDVKEKDFSKDASAPEGQEMRSYEY